MSNFEFFVVGIAVFAISNALFFFFEAKNLKQAKSVTKKKKKVTKKVTKKKVKAKKKKKPIK